MQDTKKVAGELLVELEKKKALLLKLLMEN